MNLNLTYDDSRRLPFDWKNPIGYLIATVIQLEMIKNSFRYTVSMLAIGIAFYMFSIMLVKDVIDNLQPLIFDSEASKLHRMLQQKEPSELLSNFIRIFSNAKQFSTIFYDDITR